MTQHLYPKRDNSEEFQMCTCTHGKGSHETSGFWTTSYDRCEKCECPKYHRDPDTIGNYVECGKDEAELSSRSGFTGCITYYKKET